MKEDVVKALDLLRYGKPEKGNIVVMGIVNVTPDSFSDGGRFLRPETALEHGRALVADGADVLDVGGESTRPGFEPVPAEEEWARLSPVVGELVAEGVTVSIDTTKAFVARRALEAGAMVINDVWGFQADADMASVVADSDALAIVMHNRHAVDEALDLRADWRRFFDTSLEHAERAGLPRDRVVLDPGVGFGKTQLQNVEAVARLGELRAEYDLPVLLGVSRKSMFGHFLGRPTSDRLAGTLATHLYGVEQGATMLRVHDVREHVDALTMRQILKGVP
ncbi:dihydropteroate synthase [Gluconobacter kanchanaburiensis]|uniref:Dihydropteroate synthase n=1 Tax=Gluconobacter kanchanaburiensis NBRC 103587 TaxID=1307948 RepID=A0A511B8I8_9PROT|nr:dihydropteroate synthase [Gluconobacter kanchanaburiensis]GBR70320.1 dihydropteroate synthase [Gluconobacter kanchanaburiensis NBRC 103587]GEK96766.1 dihydropteroate synthase [Gluconobacter kanchanaburiensis NBRC 103587]